MPSLAIWLCSCGIKWRVALDIDDFPWIFQCECKRERVMTGLPSNVSYTRHAGLAADADGERDPDWWITELPDEFRAPD
jgi:hypothetical protein